VPVIGVLQKMLVAHRARAGNPSDGFIFRGLRLGHPIDAGNLSKDQIRPLLKAKSSPLGWLGWQAFRRGLAANLHAMGVE